MAFTIQFSRYINPLSPNPQKYTNKLRKACNWWFKVVSPQSNNWFIKSGNISSLFKKKLNMAFTIQFSRYINPLSPKPQKYTK